MQQKSAKSLENYTICWTLFDWRQRVFSLLILGEPYTVSWLAILIHNLLSVSILIVM